MWVVANGAPKTGSTWIVMLLRATGEFSEIPSNFQNPRWYNPSALSERAREAANELGPSEQKFLSKQHWVDNGDFLSMAGIRILNTIRDIRDTIVSQYYHSVRINNTTESIDKYVANRAELSIERYCNYHEYWIKAAEHTPSSYYISAYEYLSKDDIKASRDLFSFCEIELPERKFDTAVASARFSSNKSGPGMHLRKGKVHAFADDLSESSIELIMAAANSCGLRQIKRKISKFNPTLEPYLEMTDVGL